MNKLSVNVNSYSIFILIYDYNKFYIGKLVEVLKFDKMEFFKKLNVKFFQILFF